MTETRAPAAAAGAAAPRPAMTRGPFGFPGAMPPQKAKHFKRSVRRLIGLLAPERAGAVGVVALAVSSIMLGLPGPWIIGQATNVIFRGWFGMKVPDDVAWRQAIASADAAGHHNTADMMTRLGVAPGHGVTARSRFHTTSASRLQSTRPSDFESFFAYDPASRS